MHIKYYYKMKITKTLIYFIMLSSLTIFLSSCNNQSGNMNNGLDKTDNGQMTKGVTVKERQRFHTQAQRSLDSLQRLIDNTDKAMKKQDNASRQKWDGTRDSLRHILDHANRKLNNQSYKSDDEWNSFKNSVNDAIDSAQSVLKRTKS